MFLTKSKYTQGVCCEKKLWLSSYQPEVAQEANHDAVFETGNKIGELARGLFGEYVLIAKEKGYQNMVEETKKEMNRTPSVICEASFQYENNFCSVDILKNNPDGVEIYEVKSSTSLESIYIDDISYQAWVLQKSGFTVQKACLVYVNNQYVKEGDLDIHKFFVIEDVTHSIDFEEVEKRVNDLQKVMQQEKEPSNDLSLSCKKPYDCPFFEYCTRSLPKPNVFDIGWSTRFSKKIDMYHRGHISYEDVIEKEVVNDKATEQIRFVLEEKPPKINPEEIKELMDSLYYPIYFLDFESYQDAIPRIDGTKPYQQICFQYSLHYILEENGEILHKEFLSDDYDGNPMYGLCKQLCEDIPMDSCVTAYNKAFECTRLKEMSRMFPEFAEHLLNISEHIIDLEVPFAKQDYYVREMAGRSSIKVVLPALYPNDPTLDYHNLEQVHKGDEASNAYLSLPNLSKEEEETLRYNLLKYCKLDTYAMVKIWEKLKEVS